MALRGTRLVAGIGRPLVLLPHPGYAGTYQAGPPDGISLMLNIIWVIFAGFWLALLYLIVGVVLCVLIITIPFGIQSFKLAGYALWPFGRAVVYKPGR